MDLLYDEEGYRHFKNSIKNLVLIDFLKIY